MDIDIMGSKWTIVTKTFFEDDAFDSLGVGGYCEMLTRNIVVCDMSTYPGYEAESAKFIANLNKEILRHEVIHAYLFESGLNSSCHKSNGPWALDEEIIDWIALQAPKFLQTFKTLGIL